MEIYVGNLSGNVTKEDLKKVFETFGTVSQVKLKKDLFTGKNKGYAFVVMTTDSEAKAAIKGLNGQDLQGQSLKVSEARSHDNWKTDNTNFTK